MISNNNINIPSLVLAISFFSCGVETAPDSQNNEIQNLEELAPETPTAPEIPTTPPHPLAALVEGTYALRTDSVTEGNFPIIGRIESRMISYALATIQQEGEGFTVTEQSCRYEMGGGSDAMISDTVPTSLEPVTAVITFEGEGDNITYQREETVQLIGIRLDDPANDPLPTDPEDERIFDQEGDGKPGATASIAGGIDGGELLSGDAYFIQRQKFSYSGTRNRNGKLTGLLDDDSNQQVIDATNGFLMLEITNSVPLPELSTATLVPLNGQYDCARISAESATLFPNQ